jgi:hypothetical protein
MTILERGVMSVSWRLQRVCFCFLFDRAHVTTVADHIRRRGIFSTQQLSGLQVLSICLIHLFTLTGQRHSSSGALWLECQGALPAVARLARHPARRQHHMAASRDRRLLHHAHPRAGRAAQQRQPLRHDHFEHRACCNHLISSTHIEQDIRPTLIHQTELAKRGWLTLPTTAEIYTTQSIGQEEHDEQSIAYQTGRGTVYVVFSF